MNDISPISMERTDVTSAVREAAMLADVSISVWGGSQNDPNLMEGVKAAHNARGDVGKVIKYLMAGANTRFKSTRAAFFAVRNHHYKLTLPWVSDPHAARAVGPRLLPHLIYPRYVVEMSGLRREAYAELDEFVAEYPDLVIQAKANLGSMVDDSAYPSPEQLRNLYRVHFDFEPLPAGTQFGGLDDHMLERLSSQLQKKQERQAAMAEREMWEKVRKPVEHMIERLSDENTDEAKTFKAATIENVREVLTLLPGWNVTGNPIAKEIGDQLEHILEGLEPEALRTSSALRASTVNKTKSLVDKMKAWGI